MDNEMILDDGEICDVCGEPVFFYGETETECPNCGQTYKLGEEQYVLNICYAPLKLAREYVL